MELGRDLSSWKRKRQMMAHPLALLLALLCAAHLGTDAAVAFGGGAPADADALRDIWSDPLGFLAAWGAGDQKPRPPRILAPAASPRGPPWVVVGSWSRPRRIMREGSATAPTTASAPAATRRRSRNEADRWSLGIFLGIIVGGVAGLLLGGGSRMAKLLWRQRRPDGIVIFHPKISPAMLLASLDRPESFQQMEVLGSGAAGKVYKTTLQNGLTVAVKRIPVHAPAATNSSSGSRRCRTSFGKLHVRAEMETLGKIRHLNLTWLYAYMPRLDAHLLLYQFMPNGSLADALQRVRGGSLELDWKARQRIAIGMAAGLKYLHYDCKPKVLHRDLKTANILLDENYEAHLGDFGLAKALPDEMTHVTTQLAGTVGYIAPEYSQTCTFTTSSDVYSMGVVLGVLLCGKEPTDGFFGEIDDGLVGWMCHLIQTGQEVQGIDPKLLQVSNGDQPSTSQGMLELAEMKLMMQVVCLCTLPNPVERPSMQDVMVMLNPSRQLMVRSLEELINHE